MTFRFLSPAQQDLAEAIEYYEKAVLGLGLEFVEEVERTVRRILLNPQGWTRVSPHHRRCRTRRFPYGIIYSIEGEFVLISAVFNLRRHPDAWKDRI
jgi:plasmid stabilization system protein ParE